MLAVVVLCAFIAEMFTGFKAWAFSNYEMLQTFNTADDYASAKVLTSIGGAGGSATISHLTGDKAVSGEGSLSVAMSNITTAWDFVAVNVIPELPKSGIANAGGIFIRLKANNPEGAYWRINFNSSSTDGWGVDTFALDDFAHWVTKDGTVGTGKLPANFDGYVFLDTSLHSSEWQAVYAKLVQDGGVPVNLMLYGAGCFANCILQIDNVGSYVLPADNNGYKTLAEQIAEKYPDNTGSDPDDKPSDKAYEMLQTFNTADDYASAKVLTSIGGAGGSATISHLTGDKAVSGEGSLSVAMSNITTAWDFVAVNVISELPKSTLDGAAGVFLRVKADNPKGSYFRLNFNSSSTDGWSVDTFALDGFYHWVDMEGKVKVGNLPENFDGYVFLDLALDIPERQQAFAALLQSGKVPLNLMLYGADCFANCTLAIDNIGTYVLPADNDGYAKLAEQIIAEYPENKTPGPSNPDDKPDEPTLTDDLFQIIQTFDTETDYAKVDSGTMIECFGTGTLSHRIWEDALSGKGSVRILMDSISTTWDFFNVKVLQEAPVPTIKNLGGLFFRIKANNKEKAYMRISLTDSSAIWSKNTFAFDDALYLVDVEGNVYTGSMPADFDGYVFLNGKLHSDELQESWVNALKEGENPLNIMLYGAGSYSDAVVEIDNVGYYALPSSEQGYADLAAKIWEAYPDNNFAPRDIRLFINDNVDPSYEAVTVAGRKVKLTAVVNENLETRVVEWSVISGSAVITPIENKTQGQINASLTHSCEIDFLDSGTVVVRAAIKGKPDLYSDFTFTVNSNATELSILINNLKNQLPILAGDDQKNLSQAIAEAQKVLDSSSSLQKDYQDAIEKLSFAAATLGVTLQGDETLDVVISGVLLDENGEELTDYTVWLDGEEQGSSYRFEEIGRGAHTIEICDANGYVVATYKFVLWNDKELRIKDNILYVAENMTAVRLCLELKKDGVDVVQFSADTAVSGSTDDTKHDGDSDSPITSATGVSAIVVATVLGILSAYILYRNIKRKKHTV